MYQTLSLVKLIQERLAASAALLPCWLCVEECVAFASTLKQIVQQKLSEAAYQQGHNNSSFPDH